VDRVSWGTDGLMAPKRLFWCLRSSPGPAAEAAAAVVVVVAAARRLACEGRRWGCAALWSFSCALQFSCSHGSCTART
jgi:hypothetical protein